MTPYELLALIITLTALFSIISESLLELPKVVGPMVVALLVSAGLAAITYWNKDLHPLEINTFQQWLTRFDFSHWVLNALLGLLLFAGAMHMPVKLLERNSRAIFSLAIFATLISTAVIGAALWGISHWVGLPMNIWMALVFGALISPTDPVAVLALLKNMNLPPRLETIISGESLFNDAIGVVLFTVLSQIAFGETESIALVSLHVLGMEVGGGLLAGFILGLAACWLISISQDETTQALITLAVACGGYSLALRLGVSGPIAMVIAGIMVGNLHARSPGEVTAKKHIQLFWQIIDNVLNTVLFVLIGIQLLQLPETESIWIIPVAILLSLLGRFMGVLFPTLVLKPAKAHVDNVTQDLIAMLTWSGLRGGVSVALVMTLPISPLRDQLLVMTYAIVVFSIIVQGLSMNRLFSKKEFVAIDKHTKKL